MDIYDEMIRASQSIAATFPEPRFYRSCASELAISREMYHETPLVALCLNAVAEDLSRNPGHGLYHAEKVAIEAGALVLVEGAVMDMKASDREEAAILAQAAGLLHDMRRRDEDHAKSGAIAAASLLERLGVPEQKKHYVVQAIAGHEAFTNHPVAAPGAEKLIGDALYDADKFRWGPDNFTVTLWEMLRFSSVPIASMISRFPEGMKGIARIKDTFRSHTGRLFGPEFIDLGLAIGDKIYEYLLQNKQEGDNIEIKPCRRD